MSTIAERIGNIVTTRREQIAPIYYKTWGNAENIVKFALNLKHLTESKNWQTLLEKNPKFRKEWESVVTIKLANNEKKIKLCDVVKQFIKDVIENIGDKRTDKDGKEIIVEKGYFEAIKNKVDRDVIEVCLAGPVSSGKSTFLRALTGAPEAIIPSGTNKTTAARTSFSNVDSQQKSATVHFYKKAEFRAIVNEYVVNLNQHLANGSIPFEQWEEEESISTFRETIKNNTTYDENGSNIRTDTIRGAGTNCAANEYFQTFRMYIEHSDYDEKIGANPVHLSKEELDNGDLVPFVSYKASLQTNKQSYVALAVKEAVVNWPLKASDDEDLGALRLVDTMGIGEPKFQVETELLEIIKKHADLAIALCRQESANGNTDTSVNKRFIDVLRNMKNRKMEDWVYYLCNKQDNVDFSSVTTIDDLRTHIFEHANSSNNAFALKHFHRLAFVKNGQDNSSEIVKYFTDIILGNLEQDIAKVDQFFIDELQKEYSKYKDFMETVLYEMRKCLHSMPMYSNDEKNEEVGKRVSRVYQNLEEELEKVKTKLFQQDEQLRNKIIEQIKPILQNTEIFRLYGTKEVEGFPKAQILEKEDLFKVFDNINRQICKIGLSVKWETVKTGIPDKDKAKNYDTFFEQYINATIAAIKSKLESIKGNYDIDDPEEACNYTGRELQFFIRERENLYKAIWERGKVSAAQVGVEENDISEAKRTLWQGVKNAFNSELSKQYLLLEIAENPGDSEDDSTKEKDPIKWVKSLLALIGKESINMEINSFIDAKVNLPAIVDKQTGKSLRRLLLDVNLNYADEESAATATWYSLFNLDFNLRKSLLSKYEETFSTYNIFVNMVTPLYDRVFCINQPEKIKREMKAYCALESFIRTRIANNYDNEDIGMCADAARQYRNLCNQ